ncbi:MAG: pantoate--beta-alanine ligase [Ginsengibacter sp.]
MIIFKHQTDLNKFLQKKSFSGRSIGFVPTMGALHSGHLSLLKKCTKVCQITVCSIFVNPTQFNNPDDFKKYPKTVEKDILILEENGCDILFLPDEKEIYPDEASRKKEYNLGYLETILEGKFRPGHFQGVCQVVEKLLHIVEPDILFLGQKDFQQCMVIKRLIEILQADVRLIICPILREENGLAMSSRNLRLNATEIQTAASMHQSLISIKDNLISTNFVSLKNEAIKSLENKGFRVEYLELATTENLELVIDFQNGQSLILLIAAFLNNVRLIDNLLINP